jgi:hypothetical protein
MDKEAAHGIITDPAVSARVLGREASEPRHSGRGAPGAARLESTS